MPNEIIAAIGAQLDKMMRVMAQLDPVLSRNAVTQDRLHTRACITHTAAAQQSVQRVYARDQSPKMFTPLARGGQKKNNTLVRGHTMMTI